MLYQNANTITDSIPSTTLVCVTYTNQHAAHPHSPDTCLPQCIPRNDRTLKSPYGIFRYGYDGFAAVYRVHGIIAAPRPRRLLAVLGVEDWENL